MTGTSGPGLDWRAVATGTVITLAIVLPVVFIVRALTTGDEPSPVEVLVPMALLFGFSAGGFGAARRAGRLPYGHAIAACLAAWAVSIVLTVIRAGITLAQALTLVTIVMVTLAVSIGGAHLALRKAQQEQQLRQRQEQGGTQQGGPA